MLSFLVFVVALGSARDVLINRNDIHVCVKTMQEKDLRQTYPDCLNLVKPNSSLTSVEIEFDSFVMTKCDGDEEFKMLVADSVNNYCIRYNCSQIGPESVVLLSIDTNKVVFVVSKEGTHLQLHDLHVVDSRLVVYMLVLNPIEKMRIRSLHTINVSYTTAKPVLPLNNATQLYLAAGFSLSALLIFYLGCVALAMKYTN